MSLMIPIFMSGSEVSKPASHGAPFGQPKRETEEAWEGKGKREGGWKESGRGGACGKRLERKEGQAWIGKVGKET